MKISEDFGGLAMAMEVARKKGLAMATEGACVPENCSICSHKSLAP